MVSTRENLFSLPSKKRTAFLQKLSDAGMTSDMLVGALSADSAAFERWVQQCPHGKSASSPVAQVKSGLVYDASAMSRILDIPIRCTDSAPLATRGGIVGYYDGWQLPSIRSSVAGKKRMWQDQDWYEKYGWKAKPGYYEVLFQLVNSNRSNWDKMMLCLEGLQKEDPAWQACPIVIGAPILLAHLSETGEDLLNGNICRCAEALPDGRHAGLYVYDGRVFVSIRWDGLRRGHVWLAVCRKL